MDEKIKFDIRFDKDAAKEYQKIKLPDLEIVDKSIDELMYRADEVGKPLGNNSSTKLAGCREIKLRNAGIRIIYRVTAEQVDILRVVYVLAIERRSNDFAFKQAHKRYKKVKNNPDFSKNLKHAKKWKGKDT